MSLGSWVVRLSIDRLFASTLFFLFPFFFDLFFPTVVFLYSQPLSPPSNPVHSQLRNKRIGGGVFRPNRQDMTSQRLPALVPCPATKTNKHETATLM